MKLLLLIVLLKTYTGTTPFSTSLDFYRAWYPDEKRIVLDKRVKCPFGFETFDGVTIHHEVAELWTQCTAPEMSERARHERLKDKEWLTLKDVEGLK